jgi:hypothetical protein
MNGLSCLTLSDANTYRAATDTAAGYPKDGINIGGGIHASVAEGRTYHQANVLPHPTLALAAVVPWDAAMIGLAVAPPAGATVQIMDASWIPVVSVGQTIG